MLDFVSFSCSKIECHIHQCSCFAVNLSFTDLHSCKTYKKNVSDDLDEADEGDMDDNDSDNGGESSNEPGEEHLDDILDD